MFNPTARHPRHSAPKQVVERREARVMVTKTASLCLDGREMVMPATVRDLNKGGARISVANVNSVPDVVMLNVRSDDLIARAKVAWRKQPEVGLKFIRSGDLLQEERFRREQAAHWDKLQADRQRLEAEQRAAAAAVQAKEDLRQQQLAHYRAQQIQALGLDPRLPVTESDLKQAYRAKAMRAHPDHGGSMEEFQHLNQVYNYLMQTMQPGQS